MAHASALPEPRAGAEDEAPTPPTRSQGRESVGATCHAPDTRGAVVYRLDPRSSAARAGIEPADIIVGFNGTEVTDPGHLERLMSDAPIGSTATVRILRDGKRMDVRVQIQKRTS